MADYDLDFGKKSTYVPCQSGDGVGRDSIAGPQRLACSWNWSVGQSSYAGAADGDDEPWFSRSRRFSMLDLKRRMIPSRHLPELPSSKIAAFAENGVVSKAYDSLMEPWDTTGLEASAGPSSRRNGRR
jgi:hypothetical protein